MGFECPELDELPRLIAEKARLAENYYKFDPGRKRWVRDTGVILDAAKRMFPRLQTIHENVEPDEHAYRSILYTLPGLTACYHMRLYLESGVMKNEFFALEGSGGTGKSTIAYYLAKWLNGVMITPEDDPVYRLYELLEEERWVPILVFDDIATRLSKYWFMDKIERRRWTAFFKALELVRDVAGVVLITARTFSGVAKRLRELSTFVGHVQRVVVGRVYVVDVIEWRRGDESPLQRPRFIDIVWSGVKLPGEVYRESLRRRRELARKLLEEAILVSEEEEAGEE